MERELARFRGLLEVKYANPSDAGYTYVANDGERVPLTPSMMSEWARACVRCPFFCARLYYNSYLSMCSTMVTVPPSTLPTHSLSIRRNKRDLYSKLRRLCVVVVQIFLVTVFSRLSPPFFRMLATSSVMIRAPETLQLSLPLP